MNLLNAAASTFSLCVLLVLTQRWHGAFTLDLTHGMQKSRTAPTRDVGCWLSGESNAVVNSLTGALVGLMTLTAIIAASLTHSSAVWSLVALVLGSWAAWVAIAASMVHYPWCSPVAFLRVKPQAVLAQ